MFLARIISLVCFICASDLQHTVSNVVFSGTVRLHDCFNQVLRHISVIGQKLLGVLGQAVTAVAKAWVVVLITNTRIKAHTLDNLLRIQSLHLRIGIQLVEIADTQSQISVGKQLNSLGFRKAHNQGVDILLDCTFLEQACKGVGSLHQASVIHISTHNDTARVQIVVKSFRLPQELRAENDVVAVVLFTHRSCKANRNRGLNNHDCVRIVLNDQLDDGLYCGSVKEVLLAIIVGRRCDNDEIRIFVCGFSIQRGSQI